MGELDNSGEWETLGEGRAVQRGEGGRFTGAKLSAERASEIGQAVPRRIREKASALGDALVAALIPTDDTSLDAQAKRLLLRELAEGAAKDNTSSIKAVDLALRLVGAEPKQPTWDGGECPTCKRGEMTPLVISEDGLAILRALLADARAAGLLPALPDASLLDRISRSWVLGDVQAMDQVYSELRRSAGEGPVVTA